MNREVIEVVKVKDRQEGNLQAHDILLETVNPDTLLALSGGTSPDFKLMIVDQGDIFPGCVCLIDERWGVPYHMDSNELQLKSTGVFDFLHKNDIEYHRVLVENDIQETTEDYDRLMFELFERFYNRVGVMGIGSNLHTAGIFPHSEATASADFVVSEQVEDKFPKRITLTLKALGEFQTFIILAFGEGKREAIVRLLDEKENDMQKYPAIFYRKSFAKSYLITDLNL